MIGKLLSPATIEMSMQIDQGIQQEDKGSVSLAGTAAAVIVVGAGGLRSYLKFMQPLNTCSCGCQSSTKRPNQQGSIE